MLAADAQTEITITDSATNAFLEGTNVRVIKNKNEKAAFFTTDSHGAITISDSGAITFFITRIGYDSKLTTIDVKPYSKLTISIEKVNTKIDDVVITGQYSLSNTKSSVYEVKVINEKDFRTKGANNLREALLGDLNIDMAQDNVFGSGVSLRGMSGESVKIMVDGVPIVGRLDGKIDLSQINLANIQRVEVIKGPMSVVYGTDAMGGVINLITKQNVQEKWGVFAKGYYETVGQYNVELGANYNHKKSQFYLSGGRNFFDGYSIKDTMRHKEWRPKEQYFADAKYIFNHKKFKMTINGAFFRELMIDRGNLRPYTSYAFDQYFLTFRPRANLSFSIPIKDLSKIDLLFAYSGFIRFYNNYKTDLTTLEKQLRNDEIQDTTKYHQLTLRGTYTINTVNKKISLMMGYDINQEFTYQERIIGLRQQMGDYAVYASMRYKPIPTIDIQPAIRFAYNTKFRSPLIPSFNFKWDAAKFISLRLSYGMGYRAPSLKELYLIFLDSNHNLNGNEDLSPEKGHNANITLVYNFEKKKHKLQLSGSGFFNYIDNKIDFAIVNASSAPITYQYTNLSKYITYGGEFKADYKFDRLSISAGTSIIQYDVTNQSSKTTSKLLSPDATVGIAYRVPYTNTNITFNYKYTGKKLMYALNSSLETGYRNPFHGIDISASQNFWKDRIQLTVGGKNLMNVTNVGAQNVSGVGHNFDANSAMVMWGRTFFTSLNFYFSKI